MAEKTLNFHKLSDCVINQLKKQNYMDSTLMVYRRIYNRIYSLMKKLGIPENKTILTLDKVGNTSASSIPIALDDGFKSGKIKKGDGIQ